MVKGFYRRPLRIGDKIQASGGGRVTELMARPLINLFYPELSGVLQPLSGEYAGRRTALEQAVFFSGYGVETGLLIDVFERYGLAAIAQVDLLERIHKNQSLEALSKMAFVILQAIMQKLEGRIGQPLLQDVNRTMKLARATCWRLLSRRGRCRRVGPTTHDHDSGVSGATPAGAGMMELWLVRHGQTDWNLQGRYQGHIDLPLNAQGLRQADDARGTPGRRRVHGDLQQRPAARLCHGAGHRRGPPPTRDRRSPAAGGQPRRLGRHGGRRHHVRVSGRLGLAPARPGHARPPGGESLLELATRVAAAVDDLAERHAGGPLLVVAHGLALATLVCRAHGHDLGRAYDLIPENAHPLVIDWPAPTVPELETSRHELSR